MAFHVGQKVVCVKETPWVSCVDCEIGPAYKQICTIRAIHEIATRPFLQFVEIINPELYPKLWGRGGECSFDAKHFRPVVERKTDISIFTAMLTPKKAKETISCHG